MADSKDVTFRVIFDFVLLCIVILPSLILVIWGRPFKRGFFCDDETIALPFRSQTVPLYAVAVLGLGLPIVTMVCSELVIYLRDKRGHSVRDGCRAQYVICGWTIHGFLVMLYAMLGPFLFGAAVSQSSTDITKYTVGRLRPHFITVCAPDWTKVNCLDVHGQMRYVEEDVCTGNHDDITEARVSHPSGHSSFASYCMVYLVLYMQARFTWRGSRLWYHLLQMLALFLTVWVCLTRVSDYFHHWSDVLGGAALGVAVAIIVTRYASTLFTRNQLKELDQKVTELHSFVSSGTKVDGYGSGNATSFHLSNDTGHSTHMVKS